MTKTMLTDEYFEWICDLIGIYHHQARHTYTKLLRHLQGIDFEYVIDMDGNRAEDGVDLRYRFGYEHSYEDAMIAALLDDRPCSVLEMMVSLAMRCEEHIMDDPEIGNRTGEWFWNMVSNLGLEQMDDYAYQSEYVDAVISKFLNREYDRDGHGGLFTVPNCKKDLRSVEIWYQMCWYLNAIL
ncbi:MAG: hypothetical protein EUB_01567 [Eubacterium sp.]|uniref:hypothetical protein n=1 Tax=Eubacterium sp. TaxID=142586 RepID=UPI00305C4696